MHEQICVPTTPVKQLYPYTQLHTVTYSALQLHTHSLRNTHVCSHMSSKTRTYNYLMHVCTCSHTQTSVTGRHPETETVVPESSPTQTGPLVSVEPPSQRASTIFTDKLFLASCSSSVCESCSSESTQRTISSGSRSSLSRTDRSAAPC